MTTLMLASSSKIRAQILLSAGFDVEVVHALFDEALVVHPTASERAVGRAIGKAQAAKNVKDRWVLGCDQVVELNGVLYGKPKDASAHVEQLMALRGQQHSLHCGYAIVTPSGKVYTGTEKTSLRMRSDISEAELKAYVATGEGSACAGGYAIEGHGSFLFLKTVGDWNNILGLPLFRIVEQLRILGWRYGKSGFGVYE